MQTEALSSYAAGSIRITADIVAAYISKNSLPSTELPDLITAVHQSIAKISAPEAAAPAEEPQVPAVPIKKSVTNDFIVCLEDGKKFKSLRRHLAASFGMTPDQYRTKWSLPTDYPMVAPAYAATRSELAKQSGLGRVAAKAVSEPVKKGDAAASAQRSRSRKAA